MTSQPPPPLRFTRWKTQDCSSCDGCGTTRDLDDDGVRVVCVRCEGCEGTGKLMSCQRCYDVIPATEGDRNGGICGPCVREAETADAEVERNYIARVHQ